jgi:hypothetical protein
LSAIHSFFRYLSSYYLYVSVVVARAVDLLRGVPRVVGFLVGGVLFAVEGVEGDLIIVGWRHSIMTVDWWENPFE